MNLKNKLVSNFSYTLALRVLQHLASLVSFFYIIHKVPGELIGQYQFVLSIVSLVSVSALPGVRTALTQVVARHGKGPFKLATVFTILGSALGSVILLFLSLYFGITGNLIIASALAIAALINPVGQGLLIWRSAYYGREQYKQIAIIDSITAIATSGSIIASTFITSNSPALLVLIALSIPAIQNTIWWVIEYAKSNEENGTSDEITKYGLKSSIYQLVPTIAQEIDKISVFNFVSFTDLAIYNASTKVPQIVKGIISDIGSVLIPEFSRIQYYSKKLDRIILFSTLPVSACIIVFAFTLFPWIFERVIPEEYYDAIFYGKILLISVALIFYSDVQSKFIQSHSNIDSFRALTLYGCLIKIFITPVLVYSCGISGAIISVIIQRIISIIGVKLILIKYHYEIN